jgi:GNAT superfamily N-acetyltransferase
MDISYRVNDTVSVEQAIDLYRRSTLGERRPVHRPDIFAGMLRNADVLVTAWHGDLLVGVARTLTDRTYVAYLADLAVDEAWQHRGIGRQLVEVTRAQLQPSCMIVLLAAPKANDYYPKLGFEHNPRAWVLPGHID